ncbi:MAG: hypothetical protein ACKOBG_02465 [Actinomycetota bacterium]
MRVLRGLRILIPMLLLLAAVAAVAVVLSARPVIEDARRDAEREWSAVDDRLGPHYRLLATAANRVGTLIGPERTLARQTTAAIAAWRAARGGPLADEVAAANAVEAIGRRLVTAGAASNRVRADRRAADAVSAYATDPAFSAATITPPVTGFDRAVDRYERERTGTVRALAAAALGAEPIPAFTPVPSTPPSAS